MSGDWDSDDSGTRAFVGSFGCTCLYLNFIYLYFICPFFALYLPVLCLYFHSASSLERDRSNCFLPMG